MHHNRLHARLDRSEPLIGTRLLASWPMRSKLTGSLPTINLLMGEAGK